MNILLLGSSGLIGAAVHAKLSAAAHIVIAPTSTECAGQLCGRDVGRQ